MADKVLMKDSLFNAQTVARWPLNLRLVSRDSIPRHSPERRLRALQSVS